MNGVIAAFVATLLATMAAASADEVIVQNNGAALRAQPAKNGKVEWRVNDGYRLTVTGQQGNWLEVSAPNLPEPNNKLWVQSKQVVAVEPPPAEDAIAADFRLEVNGSYGAEFKSKCVVLRAGSNYRHLQWDHGPVPTKVDINGASVLCMLRPRSSRGQLEAKLLDRNGKIIAEADTGPYIHSLEVRSSGPWGIAAGRIGGGSYVATLGVPPATVGGY